MRIIWAEPQGRALDFPGYPVGLFIMSDPETFQISHETYIGKNQVFPKPLGERDTIRSMFGVYPNENMRFADSEALATRIFVTNCITPEGVQTNSIFLAAASASSPSQNNPARIEIESTNGRMSSLRFFDERRNLRKKINYRYDQSGLLQTENILLGERQVQVGFHGKGITIGLNGNTNTFRELDIVYHEGSRNCVVHYENIRLGVQLVRLPTEIEVRRATDDLFLHSVKMTNFQPFNSGMAKAPERAADGFGRFTQQDRNYMNLLSKYWMVRLSKIPTSDREELRLLRDQFQTNTSDGELSIPLKLRRLNSLMDLNRVLEDRGIEKIYEQYLATLADNKLEGLQLSAGYSRIEGSLLWGRYEEANALLKIWLEAVTRTQDPVSVQTFASGQLKRKEFWPAAQLLGQVAKKSGLPPGTRFDLRIRELEALEGSRKLLETPSTMPTNTVATAQAKWVDTCIDTNTLDALIKARKIEVQSLFSKLQHPSGAQKMAAKRLRSKED